MYYKRHIEKTIIKAKEMFKVLLITGSRQVGKTTTLKHLFRDTYNYITLDDANALRLAKEDPKMFFKTYKMPIIIDEVQLAPSLFQEIKRLVDKEDIYGQVILTGSQRFHLMKNITESLAGRIGILELEGLSLREITEDNFDLVFVPNKEQLSLNRQNKTIDLWDIIFRGSLPELYKNDKIDRDLYFSSYIRTYIERDVRELLNIKDLDVFSKFIIAVAARTATPINYTNISREIGVDVKTVQSWIKVLEASGVITLIRPFRNNALKRVVEMPMLYFMDTGLISYLLMWPTKETLKRGAMSGPIIETFAVSEIIKSYKNQGINDLPIYYYRDRDGKEIDLIIVSEDKLYPIEIKKTMNPQKSMTKNFSVLNRALGYKVENETILCLVGQVIYLDDNITAYPIKFI